MTTRFPGHLHVHTEYSPLDGMAKIEELILKAKEMGQNFIAITDHGSSSGLYEAYKMGQKHNFNVLLGEEFYFQNKCEELKTGHLILIAKNNTGLKNIFRMQKLAYDNVYYKPRINLEILQEHSEGLICTTACVANQVGQFILRDEPHLAINHILELKKIFGDDLYIELQSSTQPDVTKVNEKLEQISKDYGFKTVITNDVHYVDKEDYGVHEVLLCIQQQGKMNSEKRWKFECNDYWMKSKEEMLEYLGYLSEATINNSFENLAAIAEQCCGVTIESGNYLPKYCKTQEEEDRHLRWMVNWYYAERIMERGENNDAFRKDLEKELNVIQQTGYSGYFLIVNEYIQWAKENGILVGDGRGSGAGSKVAYTLGITEVNPQKHDLLFERFLSPGREPDFDVDFSDIDAVFGHLQDAYGAQNVARVGAVSRFTAKSALRKIMGVYGFSQSEIATVTGYMPKRLSFTLGEAMDESPELNQWLNQHENILCAVRKFEGIIEHFGTHAGGVIICEGLTELLPIITNSEDRSKMIVGLDKKDLGELGHYKFDILGLKSLTLMKDTIEYTGPIDWNAIDLEDQEVYSMLCRGDVLGVFQLSDQRDKVMEQQPKCFEDLIAINALIRPGVGDWNEYIKRRREHFDISGCEPYLRPTAGVIVYQDQYLLLANTYAGWDIAFSDKRIRKNKDIINDTELKELFIKDAGKNGHTEECAKDLWRQICEVVAGGYGFNRAHSTSYARLSYQTAYMKAYHPKEFYAAFLTQNIGDSVTIAETINLLRTLNINILPPAINASGDRFIPTEKGIIFPLTCVKGVGGSVWSEINRLKPIKDLQDFMDRRIPKFVKKTAIEALIKSGAFDTNEHTRYEMLKTINAEAEEACNYVYEKQSLGFYLSDSPLNKYETKPYEQYKDGDYVTTVLEVASVSVKYDKRGGEMAFIVGANKTDTIRMVVFSSVWKNNKCEEGQIVLVKGKKDKGTLLVNSIEMLE